MTEYLGSAVLELSTDLKPLEAGLARGKAVTERETAAMQRTTEAHMAAMGKSAERTGGAMTRYLTVPLAGIGIAATHMAATFDASMERVHTQSGETQKNVNSLSKEILKLAQSGRFAQGPTQIADALYRLEGAGIRGARALNAVKAASDLAAVGNANVEDTAKTLAQAYFSGIKGLGQFKDVVAELNATVGAGDLRLQQLVDALGTGILPAAHQVGLSFHDITAALAVFGDETNNVSGWTAQLATSFHFLTNPTTKAKNAFDTLNLSQDQLANDLRKPNGLSVALHDLRSALDKLPGGAHGTQATQLLGDILPGGRGRVLLVLLNQLDRLDQKYKQVQGTSGNFGEAVAKTNQQSANKIARAWSQIQADLIDVGHIVGPTLVKDFADLAGGVDHVAKAFSALPDPLQHALVKLALFAALAGPALKLGGKLVTTLSGAYAAAEATSGPAGIAAGVAYGRGVAAGVRSTYPVIEGSTTGALGISKLGAAGVGAGTTYGGGFGKGARPVFSRWGTTMGKLFAAGFLLTLPDLMQSVAQMLGLHPNSALGQELKRGYKDLWPFGAIFPEAAGGGNTPGGSHVGQTIVGWKKDPKTGGWTPVYGSAAPGGVSGGGHGVMHPGGLNVPLPKGLSGRAATIAAAAAKYHIDPNVLWGIFGAESGWGQAPASFGLTGDYPGNPKLGQPRGTSGNFGKDANRSAQILAGLIKKYGSYNAALQHYSGGSYGLGHIQDLVGQRPFGASRSGGGAPARNIGQLGRVPSGGYGASPGLVPSGQSITWERIDQGQDLKTTPGGTLLASGDGYVVAVKNDPNGFGFGYPVVHYTSGPLKGRDVYYGHTHSLLKPNQRFRAGSDLTKTGYGTAREGNARTPGWAEVGFWGPNGPGSMTAGKEIAPILKQLAKGGGAALPKPGSNKIKTPLLKQSDFMSFLQSRLDHFDLEFHAGLISATKAALEKRKILKAVLGSGALTGDTRLQALIMLLGIPAPPKPQKTFDSVGLGQLFTAYAAKNPEAALGMLSNGRIDIGARQNFATQFANQNPSRANEVSGYDMVNRTVNNPFLQAGLAHIDTMLSAGDISDVAAEAMKKAMLEKTLPFLNGDDKLTVEGLLKQISDNTRDAANQLSQQGIGAAGFLGSLTGPAADVVRGILGQYGIVSLPGGASVANIGDPNAAAGLAKADIATLMEEVNSGKISFADAWPLIQQDLGVIGQATQQTADNTQQSLQALNDLLKQKNTDLTHRLQVSQAQYPVFAKLPPFGGSFASGGFVPGPAGAARMIVAHGHEEVIPVGGSGRGAQQVHVVIHDGAVDPNKIQVIAEDAVVRVTRRQARNAGRALPSRGGGLP